MFKAAYKDEFEMALQKALYAEVSTWQVAARAAGELDCTLPWEKLLSGEPSSTRSEAVIFATYEPAASEAGTNQVVHWQVTQSGGSHG
jgi:hypothetical protein